MEEIQDRLNELQPYLETPIAIVCRTDRRSARAARILAAAGFVRAQVIRGGMTAWLDNGWPVRGQTPIDPAAVLPKDTQAGGGLTVQTSPRNDLFRPPGDGPHLSLFQRRQRPYLPARAHPNMA